MVQGPILFSLLKVKQLGEEDCLNITCHWIRTLTDRLLDHTVMFVKFCYIFLCSIKYWSIEHLNTFRSSGNVKINFTVMASEPLGFHTMCAVYLANTHQVSLPRSHQRKYLLSWKSDINIDCARSRSCCLRSFSQTVLTLKRQNVYSQKDTLLFWSRANDLKVISDFKSWKGKKHFLNSDSLNLFGPNRCEPRNSPQIIS